MPCDVLFVRREFPDRDRIEILKREIIDLLSGLPASCMLLKKRLCPTGMIDAENFGWLNENCSRG
jgi:hypothetical protein